MTDRDHELRNLDAWLEEPYQRAYEEAARLECPNCDAQMQETEEGGVTCPECEHSSEPDWGAIMEARAEARWDDDPGRDTW